MPVDLVVVVPQRLERRDGDHDHAPGAEHRDHVGDGRAIVVDVLDHVERGDQVEMPVIAPVGLVARAAW